MEVTRKSRRQVRLQNLLFLVLFLSLMGLLAWLSTRYSVQADWTAGARNTLSEASQRLLARLPGPIRITAYASEAELVRRPIQELVQRYRRFKPEVELHFVNPDTEPQRARDLGINADGALVLSYQGHTEKAPAVSEQALSNTLQRLARAGERYLVFLSGHGERDPLGEANHDLGAWGRRLKAKGFSVQTLNLARTGNIPENTAVLALAGPQVDMLPSEVRIIETWLDRGGALLWLLDPGKLHGLEPIAENLGIVPVPGTVVDPTAQLAGIASPDVVLAADYGLHPITREFTTITLFPEAIGLRFEATGGWQGTALLETADRAWSETGALRGTVSYDAGQDVHGPLALGYALSRPDPAPADRTEDGAPVQPARNAVGAGSSEAGGSGARQQRVVVIGDGDFLSNRFLNNVGNMDLGMSTINWLSHDDSFIAIPARTAPDTQLSLSPTAAAVISLGSLFAAPALLLGAGFTLWLRRRRRQ